MKRDCLRVDLAVQRDCLRVDLAVQRARERKDPGLRYEADLEVREGISFIELYFSLLTGMDFMTVRKGHVVSQL